MRPSIPREYTTLSSFSNFQSLRLLSSLAFPVSSRFPPQMLLTFYQTRAHTHTYINQTHFADSSAFFANVLLPHLLLFLVSVNPTVKEYSLPSSLPPVAYIPISISIIARELPASSGASQGCGLQMVFRRYFRFLLLSARGAYLDVSPSRAISRYLSIGISLPFARSTLSQPRSVFFSFFSPSIFVVAVISSSPFRFVLFRRLFSIEVCLHAHSRSAGTS